MGRPASPPNIFPGTLGISFASSIFPFLQGIIQKKSSFLHFLLQRLSLGPGERKWKMAPGHLVCELEGGHPSRSCLSLLNWVWSHATLA